MTNTKQTIKELYALDKKRTQGDWEAMVNLVRGDSCWIVKCMSNSRDNAKFIAAAPTIADKCLELAEENKRLQEALSEFVCGQSATSSIRNNKGEK